jgi:NAD+ synthase (glutamine-hydrolysing)
MPSVWATSLLFEGEHMKDGYIRVAAAAPVIKVADCSGNAENIKSFITKAADDRAKLLVLPELCITGYTLGDLFTQKRLLDAAEDALAEIIKFSGSCDTLVIVGLPVRHGSKLYNCAAAVHRGLLLGIVPKQHIPNYNEFYEARHFTSGMGQKGSVSLAGFDVPFGCDLIFDCESAPSFKVGVEICEDLWVPSPPSARFAQAGATIIANPSASTYVTGKDAYRSALVTGQSGRCITGYVFASCGEGESSTDLVFSGHLMIAENGKLLNQTHREKELILSDIDTQLLMTERRKITTFSDGEPDRKETRFVPFRSEFVEYLPLLRLVERHPFVPASGERYRERCREVLDIQCAGLAKRLRHTQAKSAVVAVSGGLDSTLTLLVTSRAIKKYDLKCEITAITMPGPGTTGRTRGNAGTLCQALSAELREIPIGKAVELHLADISHGGEFDTAFENVQARERMQIAMDIANIAGGLVIGTGDMSELALGFTTYNGDHMSMYGVNAGVPKTLVRHLIKYVADESVENALLHDTLYDILDTPVSPELLPAIDGEIVQKTEEIVGPYELHDFFLYYFLRYGFEPLKILRLAKQAFDGEYEESAIKGCLVTFIKRFFMSQYKRSCIPDGPKVGSVALSPRGDWRMPSDACADEWLKQLEQNKL